ncbi:hypothetical protein DID88_000078 [Monilinia fructigena]|uniref:Uncharacterized protein n=1 Tax=Monilinia fructigena TaxID=38457 RepID=A0A395IJD5_9HELO|nr:hypothetical protein DID88_000078 [Monilinia fructigena]
MASLQSISEPNPTLGNALNTNYEVDFVIDYRFATTNKVQAEEQFVKLIEALNDVGLMTEVRHGDNCALLIFIKTASSRHLRSEVYRSRVQDWLYGVRTAAPEKNMQEALSAEPMTEAERLRLAWIKEITSKYLLTTKDLEDIKDRFGEKIGFYFAFLQSYFMFLIFPAAFGFCAWVLFGQYSPIYAVVNGLWSIVYTEYWKKQETDLAVQWGVRGVSKIQHKRPDFKHEREIKDPVTGEQIKFYSPVKRLSRQLLQVPFALCATVILGSLIATCFAIEIFISEVYNGPFKAYLTFLPTIILTVFMPTLTALLTGFASKLTDLENYETVDSHDAAMVQKIFVLNFITSYMPIFLTAFVYVPFAQVIVPHLDIFQMAVRPFAENDEQMTVPKAGFQINPDRLKSQVIYFTVTAQIVNLPSKLLFHTSREASLETLVYLFSGDGFGPDGTPSKMTGWGLLLTMFFSEHIYLTLRRAIRLALSKIDSPGLQRERRERFAVRKYVIPAMFAEQYLQETLSQEAAEKAAQGGIIQGEKISRSTLEEEARESTLRGHGTAEERFWARQRGQGETIAMGRSFINKAAPEQVESKKEL